MSCVYLYQPVLYQVPDGRRQRLPGEGRDLRGGDEEVGRGRLAAAAADLDRQVPRRGRRRGLALTQVLGLAAGVKQVVHSNLKASAEVTGRKNEKDGNDL